MCVCWKQSDSVGVCVWRFNETTTTNKWWVLHVECPHLDMGGGPRFCCCIRLMVNSRAIHSPCSRTVDQHFRPKQTSDIASLSSRSSICLTFPQALSLRCTGAVYRRRRRRRQPNDTVLFIGYVFCVFFTTLFWIEVVLVVAVRCGA